MFEALRIFEPREPVTEEYQVPPIDKLGEGIPPVVVFPPDVPVALSITDSLLTWTTVPTATEYQIENLLTGVVWSIAQADIPAPTSVQISWTGYEWLIQAFSDGEWVDLYASTDDVPTPNLVTTWQDLTSAGSLPVVTLADPISSGGVLVANAAVAIVNGYYALLGPSTGFGLYSGPSVIQYSGSFSSGIPYRVRAINSAGNSSPSNVVEIVVPAFDCESNPSDPSGLTWTVNQNDGTGSNADGNWATTLDASGDTIQFDCETFVLAFTDQGPRSLIDISSSLCNMSESDRTLKITIADPAFVANIAGVGQSGGAGAKVIVNGTSYVFCATPSYVSDIDAPQTDLVTEIDVVIPAQSIATIQFQMVAENHAGHYEDSASASGTFTLAWE